MATRRRATTNAAVDAKIDAHIDICAVRYAAIELAIRGGNARMKRLEQIMISSAGAIILLLLSIVLKLQT